MNFSFRSIFYPVVASIFLFLVIYSADQMKTIKDLFFWVSYCISLSFLYFNANIIKNILLRYMYIFILYIMTYILSFLSYYKFITDQRFGIDAIILILQTNILESFDYIFNSEYFVYAIFLILCVIPFIFISNKLKVSKTGTLMGVMFLVCSVFGAKHTELYKNYKRASKIINSLSCRDQIDLDSLEAQKTFTDMEGKIHVVVVGESHSRSYWSLYGYERKTTPNIEEILKNYKFSTVINNAFSCDKMTATALASVLTEKEQYSRSIPFANAVSIIDICNRAGLETYWISNQAIYGFEKDSYNIIASYAKNKYSVPFEKQKYLDHRPLDEKIINIINKIHFSKDKEHVVFIHLMGNHAPYAARYNKDYCIYPTDNNVNSLNAYDNATLYSDNIISSLYKYFSKLDLADFIYFSDHGELPGTGRDKLDRRMFEIPVFAIFNMVLNTDRASRINNFVKNSNDIPFTNDCIYDTLIGLYGIKTAHYVSKYDFSSSEYAIKKIEDIRLGNGQYSLKKNGELVPAPVRHELSKTYYYSVNSNGLPALFSGWSHPESWGTWSSASRVRLIFYVDNEFPSHIEMELNAFLAGDLKQQRIRPTLNGLTMPEIVLRNNQEQISLDISNVTKQGNNYLDIELPDAVSPKTLGISEDARTLAIGLKSMRFVQKVK